MKFRNSTTILILFAFAIPALNYAGVDSSSLEEYFITCDADSFDYILNNPFEDHYIAIRFTHLNKTWTSVRLRIRGDSSRDLPKKSFKIKFDGQPFTNGREELNFNADYLDKTYLHSILSSHLMRKSGQPCFEAEPARLFMNGKFYGLYIRVENMGKDFLVASGLDPDGNLYKAARDGASMSIFDDVYYHWEKKTNKNADRTDLQDFIYHINHVSDADYFGFAVENFYYDKMVNMIAINMLIANGSTYYHNYYLYHDIHNSKKWIMFPWDLDLSFSLYGVNYPYHRSSGYGVPDNPFLERAILGEPIFNDIKNRIEELASTSFNSDYLFPIIDSLTSVLATSIEQDRMDDVASKADWLQAIENDKDFILNRDSKLLAQLNSTPKSFQIERASHLFADSVTFRWHPAIDPNGDRITYRVKFSDRKYFRAEYTTTFLGITDTFFTLPTRPEDGHYYWLVSASDGNHAVDGFDSWNTFYISSRAGDLAIINEINYNSADSFDPGDWVELYNPHFFEIDLSAWIFKDEKDDHVFHFPSQTKIKPDHYLVICQNRDQFEPRFPGLTNITGDFAFGLSHEGELIRLFDPQYHLIDSLTYSSQPPWRIEPDGNGATLELIDPFLDNSLATNWTASIRYGTPGKKNSSFAPVVYKNFRHASFQLYQNYPNPFNYTTEIICNIPEPGTIELNIYNIEGQLVKTIRRRANSGGPISLRWSLDDLSSGIYFYRVKFNDSCSLLKKAILLK